MHMSWSERYTIQEHVKWHRFGTVALAQSPSEKQKETALRHFVHLMWIPAPSSPSPPETEPSVQAVMSLWVREDRWEVAAGLQREGRSLREHGVESWCEIV